MPSECINSTSHGHFKKKKKEFPGQDIKAKKKMDNFSNWFFKILPKKEIIATEAVRGKIQ